MVRGFVALLFLSGAAMPQDVTRELAGLYDRYLEERAEATQARDEWTLKMFNTGKYKSSEIYSSPTDPALLKERDAFVKTRTAERISRAGFSPRGASAPLRDKTRKHRAELKFRAG